MNTLRRLIRDRPHCSGSSSSLSLILAAVFAYPLSTFPQDVTNYDPPHRLLPPDGTYWFGTDRMGGDIYSRLLFGARLTILIAVVATSAAVLIGVPVGLVAGYYTNRVSDLLMRVSDIFLAVPQIVLAIAIAQTLGPAIQNVILALSVTYWPFWARLVYAETRSVKNEVFIEAAIALGASPLRVMVAACPAVDRIISDRADNNRHGWHDPGRCCTGLSRPRPAAADPGVGSHDRRKP